jgi:hypothetical protein
LAQDPGQSGFPGRGDAQSKVWSGTKILPNLALEARSGKMSWRFSEKIVPDQKLEADDWSSRFWGQARICAPFRWMKTWL